MHGVDAGGGFGVRGEFYPEDFLIPWLSLRLGRPVKWAEDRAEHLVAVNHSRQQHHRIAAAFDDGGRILALADDVAHDNGAYCRTHGVTVPELTVAMLPGPYRVPAYRGRIRVVLTNKTPCGTYRAPGRFEGTAAREHLLDVAADQLGLDRIELRRRNLLGPSEIPHRRPIATLGTDLILDTGDYPALLAASVDVADRLGYRALAAGPPEPGLLHGFGLALFVEKSGLGPQETADVTVSKSGAVHVYSGGTSLGQGIETVLAQIAADALGVEPGVVFVTRATRPPSRSAPGPGPPGPPWWAAARCTRPRPRSGSGLSSWPRGSSRSTSRTWRSATVPWRSAATRTPEPRGSAWPRSREPPSPPAVTCNLVNQPACRPAAASRSRT